jgi:hypothetical protein
VDDKTFDRLLHDRKPFWASGWPVIAPGLFMGYLGNLGLTIVGSGMTAESYERLLVETERTLAVTGHDDDRFVLYMESSDGPYWRGLSLGDKAAWMKRYTTIRDQHRKKLAERVLANAVFPASALARTALRTILAFSRQATPISVVDSTERAWQFLARKHPPFAASVPEAQAFYDAVKRRYFAIENRRAA